MVDSVIFEIGVLKVTWYGVMYATGFMVAYAVWTFVGRRTGRDINFAGDLLLWVMASGILGARTAYILSNPAYFKEHPAKIFMLNEGGLIFYGGLLGGILGMYLFSLRRRVRFLGLLDFVVVPVPLSHFFGRVGCFLNGCCHGEPYDGPLAVRYPYMSQPWYRQVDLGVITRFTRNAEPVFPVQLVEGLFNLAFFVLIFWFFKKYRSRAGRTAGLYLMVYPVGRMCFEFLRGDERMAVAGLSAAQILSIGLFLTGAWFFIRSYGKDENCPQSIN